MTSTLIHDIAQSSPEAIAFALVWRPTADETGVVDAFIGDVQSFESLDAIPLALNTPGEEALLIIPYRQLRERGFSAVDDGERLQALLIRRHDRIPLPDAMAAIQATSIRLSNGRFDVDDDAYAALVRSVVADDIGSGEGSNFVLKRTYIADVAGYDLGVALAAFRRLVQREVGAHWTFLVHTGTRTLIGASPERQVSLREGVATMNPISGTYRYPASGPTLSGVLDFLSDAKEQDELYMVVDEELKMMANFCPKGGRVVGPYLKEMSRLAHTEYFIEGCTSSDPRTILHHTLFAPTVTGSPIENACRIIARYEPGGRGYYAGALALIGSDANLQPTIDSSIIIRTADIDAQGRMRVSVGASIVRDSDPQSEAAETAAKARALLSALDNDDGARFRSNPAVRDALQRRNTSIADFWLANAEDRIQVDASLLGRRALIVDAEDAFTAMLAQHLSAIGLNVTVCRSDARECLERDWDLVVMGPGPGDPRNQNDPRIVSIRAAVRRLLIERRAFLAVCLSHQVLCLELGLELIRRETPNQGVQREIDLYGDRELVGFYNTYVAKCAHDRFHPQSNGLVVEVSRDPTSHEVHALRGQGFMSIQFHAESLLTQRGQDIISSSIKKVLTNEGNTQLVELG